MYLGQEYQILDWFFIHFTENNGMAFGMEFGGDWGKLTLSLFRIVFVGFIASFLMKLVRKNADKILITSLSLILAGAIGNILDGAFYGLLFSESYHQLASFLPEGGGYAPLFFGKVVDAVVQPCIRRQETGDRSEHWNVFMSNPSSIVHRPPSNPNSHNTSILKFSNRQIVFPGIDSIKRFV